MARGTQTGFTMRVEGLSELLSSIRRMEELTPKELRRSLLDIADHVAQRGKSYAVGEHLVDDEHAPPGGGLVDDIKTRAGLTGQVAVVDTARRVSPRYPLGYSYPSRYEFEKGGARSFMRPAVEHEAPDTDRRLNDLFTRLSAESGFGGI